MENTSIKLNRKRHYRSKAIFEHYDVTSTSGFTLKVHVYNNLLHVFVDWNSDELSRDLLISARYLGTDAHQNTVTLVTVQDLFRKFLAYDAVVEIKIILELMLEQYLDHGKFAGEIDYNTYRLFTAIIDWLGASRNGTKRRMCITSVAKEDEHEK